VGPSDPRSPFRISALNNSLTLTAQKNREYKDNFVAPIYAMNIYKQGTGDLSSFQPTTSKLHTLTPPHRLVTNIPLSNNLKKYHPPLFKRASFTTPRQAADTPGKSLFSTAPVATEGSDIGTAESPQVPRSPSKNPRRSL